MLQPQRGSATLIGFSAVLMWSLLGPLGAYADVVPAFLLNAICFGISSLVAFTRIAMMPNKGRVFRQPLSLWLMGIVGVFGYHAFYFLGLRNAPPVEANLINYLWPVLIVLFSALLPGERLRWFHVAGGGLGLCGAGLLVVGGAGLSFSGDASLGYACSALAALIWGSYSVLSRRFGNAPTETVAVFCLATAVLSLLFHVQFEETVWPADASQWIAVVAMGLMPLGLSFFTWDIGMKYGDIQLLGVSAYTAPLLSTALMIVLGIGELNGRVVMACFLIVGGALVAAKDLLLKPR
ncbi:DMT family transporter [Polycladidibacter hongkongensis]|uniref:aromatic amino acid exporter YddG n=1 Tax=Polycladidibacter hongkongensis TaxID=1647556 RepID=UPI00082FA968|nr:EamA family transporter [Pseudovibrio hongkongensis]